MPNCGLAGRVVTVIYTSFRVEYFTVVRVREARLPVDIIYVFMYTYNRTQATGRSETSWIIIRFVSISASHATRITLVFSKRRL